MKNKYTETSEIFKAFCDENRIRILKMLQTGEKCGCKPSLYGVLNSLSIAVSLLLTFPLLLVLHL